MLNNVVLMGRLTADPELKTTSSGLSVCSFTIACERSYAKQGEERVCDFINVVVWRLTAECVCKYFCKGKLIALEGCIQMRKYEDKDGNKRTAFEVLASDIHFTGDKKDNVVSEKNPLVENFNTIQGTLREELINGFETVENADLPF